ncbi:DUF5686 and carboxypeptidase regulatory-like domain-containing protein [bacterium]|nr:DUF5686 and carboxypeptidase regulatory-like domain-containing protein [bacterium]
MRRKLLLFFFLVFLGIQAIGQSLSGRVTDQNGHNVAYATVYLEGTRYAAITNDKGEYSFHVKSGSYRAVFRHIGYEQKALPVVIAGAVILDVELMGTDVQLEIVEINAGKKDPAYAIMKQVIANKKEYVKQFDTYSCNTYLKTLLEKDTLPKRKQRLALIDSLGEDSLPVLGENRTVDNLVESMSKTHFQFPGKYKSVVTAYRNLEVSGISERDLWNDVEEAGYSTAIRNPYIFYQDVSEADFNFYKNLVVAPKLGDRPFISPLHAVSWQLTYKYKLEETFFEDGKVTYRISVTPRNPIGPYFEGELVIVDGIWAIKSVDLKAKPATLNFFKEFSLQHTYSITEDQRWVLEKEAYTYETQIGKSHYYGLTEALHSDYDLDTDFPRNFFGNELRRVEKEAFEKDSTYWERVRPVYLNSSERMFIQEQDSIFTLRTSPTYLAKQDSAFNHLSWLDFLFNGISFRHRPSRTQYYIFPISQQIAPLGIGGYRHTLGGYVKKRFKRGYDINVSGALDYGFNNNDLKGYGRVSYTYNPRKLGRIYVKYGDVYQLIYNLEALRAIFSRGNFINKVYGGVGHSMELFNGFNLDANVEFADHIAIDNLELSEWSQSLFGASNTPPSFEPFRELLFEVKARYTPGMKYHMEPYRKVNLGSKFPTFTLHYKKAVPGFLGSEINFDFLELGINHEFKVGTLGTSRWNAKAGKFLQAENLRFTDYKFFRGSDRYLFFNPLWAFQLLGPTISTKNEYFQGNYLHDFGGTLIGKVPLLKHTRLQLMGGGGTLLIRDGNFFHSELYTGIHYPFRIKTQRLKFGAYFVTSYSNHSNVIDSQVKFGVTFFNPAQNKWSY